jgi:hypothetical protein
MKKELAKGRFSLLIIYVIFIITAEMIKQILTQYNILA